jgi:hypothetical protein
MSGNGLLEILAGGVNIGIYGYYTGGSYDIPSLSLSLSLSLSVFASAFIVCFSPSVRHSKDIMT